MYVSVNGTFLTNDNSGSYLERQWSTCQELSINGTRIAQAEQFLRALAVNVYDRGNLQNVISFKVSRGQGYFAHLADVESFILTHASNLVSGALNIICGLPGDPQVLATAPNAVIKVASHTQNGISVQTTYNLLCGVISAGALPSTINIDCGQG